MKILSLTFRPINNSHYASLLYFFFELFVYPASLEKPNYFVVWGAVQSAYRRCTISRKIITIAEAHSEDLWKCGFWAQFYVTLFYQTTNPNGSDPKQYIYVDCFWISPTKKKIMVLTCKPQRHEIKMNEGTKKRSKRMRKSLVFLHYGDDFQNNMAAIFFSVVIQITRSKWLR